MKKRPDGFYGCEIRNTGLEKGRMDISLRVPTGASKGASARENRKEAERREAAVHLLVERREWQLLRDLRAGKFGIGELANAVRDGGVDALRRTGEAPLTLQAMTDRALEVKRATMEPGTVSHYEKVIRSLHEHFGPGRVLTEVGTDEARAWLYGPKGTRKKPWAPNTQQGAHMVAGYVWRQAIALEMEAAERVGGKPRMTRSVWDAVQPAEARTTRHSFLEPDEWVSLLERVRGRPQALFFALGCLTGLRMGEALNLRPTIDVDWTAADPILRVQPRDGEHAWKPKNEHSVRDIPLPPIMVELVREHVEAGWSGERYLIRSPHADRPLSSDLGRLWTMDWFQRAGLKYGREGEALTFHSLRHSFASWLIREGWSSTLVARLMGNTSSEVEKTYAHLSPQDTHKLLMTIQKLTAGA